MALLLWGPNVEVKVFLLVYKHWPSGDVPRFRVLLGIGGGEGEVIRPWQPLASSASCVCEYINMECPLFAGLAC